jgi:hypothetical protein
MRGVNGQDLRLDFLDDNAARSPCGGNVGSRVISDLSTLRVITALILQI